MQRLPAGLAMATALAGAGFAAISGSSTAAAATLSSTTVPAMLKQGYEPRLALGVVSGVVMMAFTVAAPLVRVAEPISTHFPDEAYTWGGG